MIRQADGKHRGGVGQSHRHPVRESAANFSASGPRTVSVPQMQRIDHEAITTFGIPRLLLMDHAGLAVARAVRTLVPEPAQPCLVCCGPGYNGGDGLCAAWHLVHRGYQPSVVLVGAVRQLKEEPAVYAHILQRLHVPIVELQSSAQLRTIETRIMPVSVIIDALLGIGVHGPVRPLYADLIALMNQAEKPVVAVDVPSGLDAETGQPHGIAVKASLTVTFGLPKHGLFLAQGPEHVGELVVDDIGIPHSLLQG